MTKKNFVLFLCIVFLSVFSVSAQNNLPDEKNQLIENTEKSFDESSVLLEEDGQISEQPKSSSTFFLLLRMVLFLAVVVACIFFVFRFMKKTMAVPDNDDMFMRIVSTLNLSPSKSVQIVTLTDKYAFLIGVSDDSVNLISQIDDQELIQAMNLYSDKQKKTKKPKNFADILDIFMPNGPRDGENVMSGSKTKITDMLEKQRNKFNNGGR